MPKHRDRYVLVAAHPCTLGGLDMQPVTPVALRRATTELRDFGGLFGEVDGTTWYSIGLVVEGVE